MRWRAPALAAVGAVALAACGGNAIGEPTGMIRQPAPNVSTVALPDESIGGAAFEMQANDGELLVVYFGYTSCPDVCPTTLADLRYAVGEMGSDGDLVDVAMITVDPDRDDAERLIAYIQTFFPGGRALRTEDDMILRSAADAFGADYEVVETDGEIDVGHTAFLYAIDSDGLIRLQWAFGVAAEDLHHDLRYLLEKVT
ncbi:MAG: SCO family protein [Acidimicrobiia bacterium]